MTWYYVLNGQQAGPVDDSELQRLFADGTLNGEAPIWRAGMPQWAPLGSLFTLPPPPGYGQCLQCGNRFPPEQTIALAGGKVCAACKPVVVQRIREGDNRLKSNLRYAGFWIRFIARLIDSTITSIASYLFQIPMFIMIGLMGKNPKTEHMVWFGVATAFAIIMAIVAAGYYEAWFLVKKGATPGKLILGLQVVRARGGKISWGLGWGRYFAHMVSGITMYVGYMMAGWDDEKRALHDRICDTRVVFGG
ncbi:MAG: RDD family protein [Acidobacteria bacterium]|nr:RDD family protein [Acidobacteriota bacterium]